MVARQKQSHRRTRYTPRNQITQEEKRAQRKKEDNRDKIRENAKRRRRKQYELVAAGDGTSRLRRVCAMAVESWIIFFVHDYSSCQDEKVRF